jgi:TolB-like protein
VADVFISYARSDETVARRVAKALQSAGLDVWWDADLPAHRAYSEVIERNLAEARAAVVLWSKNAAGSQWVRAEADFARNAGKLVQAQIDGTLPPMPFNQIQCADLKGWRGNPSHAGWVKLQASAKALVSGEDQPVAAPLRRSRWDRLRPYGWAMAALFALVVAAGLYLYTFGTPGEERKPVLAVLPFRSLDSQDASLVAGIWEDTRTAIGRNPQLIVLGPNTAQQLAEKGEGAAKKAADYILQASVRSSADRIRVSADLVRTRDGEQVWSQDFDRKLDDVFALQSQIAGEIEGRIRGRLAEQGGTTPEHIATSGEVYALYSDARAKMRRRENKSYPAARDQLERVVKLDPNFAPGWATLADVLAMIEPSQKNWNIGAGPSEKYARRAIELAPNLAAAHAALAVSLGLDGPVARAELEQAIKLDPNDYEALNWLSSALLREGRSKEALSMLRRAVEIEPLFWPAVLNVYTALRDAGDEEGVKQLGDRERSIGADYFASFIDMHEAWEHRDLAKAANIGLQMWASGRPEARTVAAVDLWGILLQLDYIDEAGVLSAATGPAPEFAPLLWRNNPEGLDMMEASHIDPRAFFILGPLTENAGRVYLLSGRSRKLADLYLSLKVTPDEFVTLAEGEGPEHFLYSAPLVALALRQNGHGTEAKALLSIAEAQALKAVHEGKVFDDVPHSKLLPRVLLARIFASEGKNEQSIGLLAEAVSRGWLPDPPMLMPDLHLDPAFGSVRGDPRFEKSRDQIMGTIARERAQVSRRLLNQLKTA